MSRTALFEWLSVAVLLIGCGVFTAGVIAIVFNSGVAAVLMIVGGVVALLGGILWTAVVKAGARARSRSTA